MILSINCKVEQHFINREFIFLYIVYKFILLKMSSELIVFHKSLKSHVIVHYTGKSHRTFSYWIFCGICGENELLLNFGNAKNIFESITIK